MSPASIRATVAVYGALSESLISAGRGKPAGNGHQQTGYGIETASTMLAKSIGETHENA